MRRKPRVVWLPPAGSAGDPDPPFDTTGWFINGTQLSVSGAQPTGSIELPLTIDAPATGDQASLSDIENSGYRLRRVVGKLFVLGDTLDQESGITVIGITAGIIVRKVDQFGVSTASQVGLNNSNTSPSEQENFGDPWIWRRSWIIANPGFFTTTPEAPLPWNNVMTGSAVDGPHIDQKTARIVGSEERLFLDISATALIGADGLSELENTTFIAGEIRILASMRTSLGNRRNASR